MSGIVYLVGAGPGDPRLLTLRGAELLREADVVVYDRLAPEALLDLAPRRAERIYAGKAPGEAELDQEAINGLIVGRALAGKTVVRLKGGDPFVFGRGGEEALACARAGVPFEVVPGVTSAVAAPAYAGIPLTHRGLAASVAVVTASRAPGFAEEVARVAGAVDTLVVLMAAGRLAKTCHLLIGAGRPKDEPAALVQWATTSDQRSVVSTLAELPKAAAAADIGPPATLVVGEVVALADELSWFAELGSEAGVENG
ncbi:MAG: uroporphyrinogen-III C-methyltransferase [Actinomycetota bacterium]